MLEKEFISGGLVVFQDTELYRFTSDALLLSRFARVKKGDVIADFCSGSGVVGFNLYAENRDKAKSVKFFEMQKPLFDLSVKSIAENKLEGIFSAENIRVQDIGKNYYGVFSLIVCNPPYMEKNSGEADKRLHEAACRRELSLSLSELVFTVGKCLKYGGRFCIVHRADRLADAVCLFRENNIEPKRLEVVSAKNKLPYLILLEGVKGGNSGIKISTAEN